MSTSEKMQREINSLKQYAATKNMDLPFTDFELGVNLNLEGQLSEKLLIELKSQKGLTFDRFVYILPTDAMIDAYTQVLAMTSPGTELQVPANQRDVFADNLKANLTTISTLHSLLLDSIKK